MADIQFRDDDLPKYHPFPHYIKVMRNVKIHPKTGLAKYQWWKKPEIEKLDTYTVKTNTHKIVNVKRQDLNYICLPYCGIGLKYELYCDEKDFYDEINVQMGKNTDLHIFLKDHHPVMCNMPRNFSWMYTRLNKFKSVQSLKGICEGRDILFVGAGPSLEGHYHELRDIIAQNKAIVIAGGSALRRLCREGVYPHFSLVYDPNIGEWDKVFSHLTPEYFKNSAFITTVGLHHDCFRKIQKGYVGLTSCIEPLLKMIEPNEECLSEGRIGVSTMMPTLASYMGCRRLFYAGIDLRFGEDGKRYVDVENTQQDENDSRFVPEINSQVKQVARKVGKNIFTKLFYKLVKRYEETGLWDVKLDYKPFYGLTDADIEEIKEAQIWTREMYVRECRDILEQTAKEDYLFFVIGPESLLVKAKAQQGHWQQLTSAGIWPALKFKDVERMENQMEVKKRLEHLRDEFKVLADDWENLKDYYDKEVYLKYMQSYDIVQDMRQVRTGDYNWPLIKAVLKNTVKWFDLGLKLW